MSHDWPTARLTDYQTLLMARVAGSVMLACGRQSAVWWPLRTSVFDSDAVLGIAAARGPVNS